MIDQLHLHPEGRKPSYEEVDQVIELVNYTIAEARLVVDRLKSKLERGDFHRGDTPDA